MRLFWAPSGCGHLGPIWWDFAMLQIRFKLADKEITIQE